MLEAQTKGDYKLVIDHYSLYEPGQNWINYCNELSIQKRGKYEKGVYAKKDFKEGDLLIVERPIAYT